MNRKKGFTLVELLAVIALLAILVLLVMSNIFSVNEEAQKNSLIDEAKEMYTMSIDKYTLERIEGNRIQLISNVDPSGTKLNLKNEKDLKYQIRMSDGGEITSNGSKPTIDNKKNATITMTHTKTVDMPKTCRDAEVLVAAAGVARMVDESYVGDGAVVIDVGINVDSEGNLCGDVDFDKVKEKASILTPVPGGVGSVTTSVLAKHLLKGAFLRRG